MLYVGDALGRIKHDIIQIIKIRKGNNLLLHRQRFLFHHGGGWGSFRFSSSCRGFCGFGLGHDLGGARGRRCLRRRSPRIRNNIIRIF